MPKVKLELISYGLKGNKGDAEKGYRSIPIADLYLDCRGVPDDKNAPTGVSLRDNIEAESQATLTSFHRVIEDSLRWMESRRSDRENPFEDPYVICFLCAHGMHRSVTCKKILADRLVKAGWMVAVK